MENKGAILIISGPSGCGKSSLLKELYKEIDDYYFSISTTTRLPREGEQHGVDYFFVSYEEFEKDIEDGQFLEHATVHGNYYGTSLRPIIQALNDGKLVIFDIDVQGQAIVKQKLRDVTTSVFITTPSLKELENRLTSRGTDSIEVIQKRIKNAKEEITQISRYDYFIVNDNLEQATSQLLGVAQACRVKNTLFDLDEFISNWHNQ
jgi:guanylate kinase